MAEKRKRGQLLLMEVRLRLIGQETRASPSSLARTMEQTVLRYLPTYRVPTLLCRATPDPMYSVRELVRFQVGSGHPSVQSSEYSVHCQTGGLACGDARSTSIPEGFGRGSGGQGLVRGHDIRNRVSRLNWLTSIREANRFQYGQRDFG